MAKIPNSTLSTFLLDFHNIAATRLKMKLNKLKVRPKKDAAAAPCAAEFATMLACWASSNDLNNIGACKDSARALQECMASRKPRGGVSKPTINYHLARLSKQI